MEVPSIFLNRILSETAKRGASSLHLSVGSVPMMRVDGRLTLMEGENILALDVLKKIIESFLEKDEVLKLEKEKEIAIVKNFAGDFRFRVNIFYQKSLPALSFNYISGVIKNLEELGLAQAFSKKINLNSGLLIIAGPNDSGKTTTAVAFIEEINNKEKKYIITLENQIEYLFVNKKSIIEQRQVGRDVSSLNDGLRHCLDEDVDLVYIGEIRKDFDSVLPFILELAAGNSLVILEINAANSVRVIEKILNTTSKKISAEAIRYSLADVLLGIISQRLIPSRGGGLSLAKEILIVNSAVKSLIREGKIYQLENVVQISREEGMISLERSIVELVKAGKVQAEEVKKLKLEM